MSKVRVGVIRGGVSPEYEVSLHTGATVLRHLPLDKFKPIDILISRDGVWHANGRPIDGNKLHSQIDVAFNALHGYYGEDGKVQQVLENLKIPYTGSGILPSALAMNKKLAKEKLSDMFDRIGILTPKHITVTKSDLPEEMARKIHRQIPPPWVVKPVRGGSSIGITMVKTLPELAEAIGFGLLHAEEVLVEEYIFGKEASCGVINDFRGEKTYSLMPSEIRKPANGIWDFENKYKRGVEIKHGGFLAHEKEKIAEAAKYIHDHLGLRHYSRSDFIVNKRGVHFLEVNSLPGLTEHSIFPGALSAVGETLPHFLAHVITLAV